jgi:hypothetical protein
MPHEAHSYSLEDTLQHKDNREHGPCSVQDLISTCQVIPVLVVIEGQSYWVKEDHQYNKVVEGCILDQSHYESPENGFMVKYEERAVIVHRNFLGVLPVVRLALSLLFFV